MGDAAEYIERLEAMAEGGGQTWDLSDNDRTAIKFILEEFDRLHGEINSLRADAARLDVLDRWAWCDDGKFDRTVELCQTGTPIRKAMDAVELSTEEDD